MSGNNTTNPDSASLLKQPTWYDTNPGTLKQRLQRVKFTRWVRFSLVALIIILLIAWVGNWWWIFILIPVADIYLTQYIPWAWWKYIKNNTVKYIMGWVDAIVYALVLVYFIFAFIGQNYQIPSSSLEKTLLTGDFLWVNKVVYGPRVPMTPLHFPLAQNTLPIVGSKSYIDNPQLPYHRLAGLRNIERNDIVVFNFPAGDTVALKVQNPDYYTLIKQFGRRAVHSDKETFGEIVYRPVDRRENYVKRVLGLPGERLMIRDGKVIVNGTQLTEPKHIQFNYFVQTTGGLISNDLWSEVDMAADDIHLMDVPADAAPGVLALGLLVNPDGTIPPIYQVPLTYTAKETLENTPEVAKIVKVPADYDEMVYPFSADYGWTHSDYATNIADGGIYIPKKGATLKLTNFNLPIYERVIRNYEGNTLEEKDDTIYINGEPADSYTFKMDYYWMMGDNRDNSADSRFWGFVPEDHVVGTPMFTLISFDKDKSLFGGKIRFNRILRDANPDK